MGTSKSPLERYRSRAASDTSWSKAGWMKSANWISATGTSPWRAIPMARPTMEDSASGVSITRVSPNSSRKSAVARNTPPRAPTSSPMIRTRSFSFIFSHSVSWIVWTMFFSAISGLLGEDVAKGRLRLGIWRVPRLVHALVHLSLQLFPDRFDLVVVHDAGLLQVAGERGDGVLLLGLLDLLAGAIGPVVIVGGMWEEPIRLAFDQRGAASRPRSVHRLSHGLVAGQHVVPIDGHAREAVPLPADGHVLDPHLLRERNRDRVEVVLAHEDDRELVDPSEVERLVPVALAGCPFPEPRTHHGVLAQVLHGIGDAGGVRHLRGDRGGTGDDAEPPVSPVRGHLPSAGRWVVGLGEDPQEDVLGRYSRHEADREVAVVRNEDVLPLDKRPRRAHLTPLMPRNGHDERGLPLPVEPELLLVAEAGGHHGAVHGQQVVLGQTEPGMAVGRMLDACSHRCYLLVRGRTEARAWRGPF